MEDTDPEGQRPERVQESDQGLFSEERAGGHSERCRVQAPEPPPPRASGSSPGAARIPVGFRPRVCGVLGGGPGWSPHSPSRAYPRLHGPSVAAWVQGAGPPPLWPGPDLQLITLSREPRSQLFQ